MTSVVTQIEIGQGSELSQDFIMDEVHPKKAIIRQKFLKPKGPTNRRPKSPSSRPAGNGNGNGEELNAGNSDIGELSPGNSDIGEVNGD